MLVLALIFLIVAIFAMALHLPGIAAISALAALFCTLGGSGTPQSHL
jgi:uncharacterized membrane protein YtjA (UPF0391 family)